MPEVPESPLVDRLYEAYTGARNTAELTEAAAGFAGEIEQVLAAAVEAGTLHLTDDAPATAAQVAALAGWERLLTAACVLMVPRGRACNLLERTRHELAAGLSRAMMVPLGAVGRDKLDWVHRGGYVPPNFDAYPSAKIRLGDGADGAAVLAAINATAAFESLLLYGFGGLVSIVPPVRGLSLTRCRIGEVAAPLERLSLVAVDDGERLIRAAIAAGIGIKVVEDRVRPDGVPVVRIEVRGILPFLELEGVEVHGACHADRLDLISVTLAPGARLEAGAAVLGRLAGGGTVTALRRVEFQDLPPRDGAEWATLAAPGANAPRRNGVPHIMAPSFYGLFETSAVAGRLAVAGYDPSGLAFHARPSPRVASDELAFTTTVAPGAARGLPTTFSHLFFAMGAGAGAVRTRGLAGAGGDYATLVYVPARIDDGRPAGNVRVGLLVMRGDGARLAAAAAWLAALPNGRRVSAERVAAVGLDGARVDAAALAAAVGGRELAPDAALGVPAAWLVDDIPL